jgi:mRNA interferase RelE/StbE
MGNDNLRYSVTFARSARKELENLEHTIALRILKKIENLSMNPRPVGCIKLAGQNALWRIRIGEYRVIYSIDNTYRIIDIIIIRHRSKVYKDLD